MLSQGSQVLITVMNVAKQRGRSMVKENQKEGNET